jgi:SNF2 family DNA or RNA helicase
MVESSAKLLHLDLMLDRLLGDHKVLIFSQFKGMLTLLGDYLTMKGVGYLKLDGDTPKNIR